MRVVLVGVPSAVPTAFVSIYVGRAMAKKNVIQKKVTRSGAGERTSLYQERKRVPIVS